MSMDIEKRKADCYRALQTALNEKGTPSRNVFKLWFDWAGTLDELLQPAPPKEI